MASTPVFGWPIPNLTDVADGPDGFSDLSLAIEATLTDKTIRTYTPAWTGDQVTPANPATRTGWYRVDHGICDFLAQLTFGSSTSGGYGYLDVGLPVAAHPSISRQIVGDVILFIPGLVNNDRQYGYATVNNASPTSASPWFPAAVNRTNYQQWRNADATGDPDTGFPNVDGSNYNIRNGGYITIQGRYFTA